MINESVVIFIAEHVPTNNYQTIWWHVSLNWRY